MVNKTHLTHSILLLCTIILGLQCSNNTPTKPFAHCKYGAPKAIFSEELSEVQKHSFQLLNESGVEQILFNNGVELEIIQSGCNEIIQEYQLKFKGDFNDKEADYWLAETAKQLIYFGGMGEKYLIYNFWAKALAAQRESLQLGQDHELEPGFFIKIDKVVSQEQALLLFKVNGQL